MKIISITNLDMDGAGDDTVDRRLCKRVELSIFAAHEVWFEDVTTSAVVLERTEVQLHRQVCSPPSHSHNHTHSICQRRVARPLTTVSYIRFP